MPALIAYLFGMAEHLTRGLEMYSHQALRIIRTVEHSVAWKRM
ncbi:hypothetical protein BCL67_11240 [Nesterenkonia sandarakina]|uniref:Uncharacterized protein n=1 Tax=Nesterenkonia sandarakina TaxID=272918 RepID=A0A2T0YGM2_9MICC|nr:hypothetical protein BCL67_11240 [Nesterenkonia sandarakina]